MTAFTYPYRFWLVSDPESTESCYGFDSLKADPNLLSSKLPKVLDCFDIQSIFLPVSLSDRKVTLISNNGAVAMDIHLQFAAASTAMAADWDRGCNLDSLPAGLVCHYQ